MNRSEKKAFIEGFKHSLDKMVVLVLARYSGLTVAQMTTLRVAMRQSSASLQVVKNRLAKIAVQDTPFQGVAPLFGGGQTLVAYSYHDPVAAAKILAEFSEENPELEIIGGSLKENFLNAQAILQLAKLPSLDVLRGNLVRLIQSPLAKLMYVTKAPAQDLSRLIQAYAQKREDEQGGGC